MTLRIGIAGYGRVGKQRHFCLMGMDEVEVVGVFDAQPLNNVCDSIALCGSFDELLALRLDAVFICTFNDSLAELTIRALDAGIHVFCEKPPARNTDELSKVLEVEARTGKLLKYGFNHRYHYSVIEAKKIIDSGEMGSLLWMRGVYGKAGSIDYHKNWRNFRRLSGGGILIDQGIHMLDLMMYFSGGEFTKVNSFVTNAFWDIEAEDNAFVVMQNDENVTAMMHSSATQWRHKFLLELCFSEGYINLDGILSGTRSYAPETLIVGRREFEDITYAMGKPRETTTSFENDHSWELEIKEFIDAIVQGGAINHGTSRDAYASLKLVETIYEHSGFYDE